MKMLFPAIPVLAIALVWGLAHGGEKRSDKAVAYAKEIVDMRSNLAKTFIKPGMEITVDTFKSVCGAVGKRVKEIENEGFTIRHAAIKYRNPANRVTEEEAAIIGDFDRERTLDEMWDTVTVAGKTKLRYTRPIFVEESCLACHGAKEGRPAWIAEKYPDDRAYDFKAGDIRGTVSVMFPE